MGQDAVRFKGRESNQRSTYEAYEADDAETAKAFLEAKTVAQANYYLIVDTPEGAWGADVHGLYLERLLPFQTRLDDATCLGDICRMPAAKNAEMAARGLTESFVAGIKCGACQHEWKDALRYQKDTVVKCPRCKALNRVSSAKVQVIFT